MKQKDFDAVNQKTEIPKRNRNYYFPILINDTNLKIGVEVGVDAGAFAQVIMKKSNLETLYGIDSWHDDYCGTKDGLSRFNLATKKLLPYILEKKVYLLRKDSVDAAMSFEDNFFDICYIDANHAKTACKRDLYAWVPKVKVGGIVSGHDFKNLKSCRVAVVVKAFCEKYNYKIKVIGTRCPSWVFLKTHEVEL